MGLRKDCPARYVDSQLSDQIFVHDVFAKGVLLQPCPSTGNDNLQGGTPLDHLVRAECHWYLNRSTIVPRSRPTNPCALSLSWPAPFEDCS